MVNKTICFEEFKINNHQFAVGKGYWVNKIYKSKFNV